MLNGMTTFAFADLSAPLPPLPPPKPGRRSYEDLAYYQLRLGRMAYLFIKGYSYRAIARDLGVSHTTVLRMAPDLAAMSRCNRASAPVGVSGGDAS